MMEFFDIAAVVYFLRKVIWIVPDFITSGCADQLVRLDQRIRDEGSFVALSTRFLMEARARSGRGAPDFAPVSTNTTRIKPDDPVAP